MTGDRWTDPTIPERCPGCGQPLGMIGDWCRACEQHGPPEPQTRPVDWDAVARSPRVRRARAAADRFFAARRERGIGPGEPKRLRPLPPPPTDTRDEVERTRAVWAYFPDSELLTDEEIAAQRAKDAQRERLFQVQGRDGFDVMDAAWAAGAELLERNRGR